VAPIGDLQGLSSSSAPSLGSESAVGLQGPLAASVAPGGRVAVVGRPTGSSHAGAIALQGRAGGAFAPIAPQPRFGAPFAATNGYLGDLAVAGAAAGGRLQLQVERFYAAGFRRHVLLTAGPGVRLLTPALDYRSDAVLVWEQGGSILAEYLPASGDPEAPQRLAATGANLRIAALLSDERRATVAWSEQRGARTDVFMDRSATGVTFGKPRLMESFANPHAIAPPAASPSLIRLSTESVMLAWSSIVAGRWVIRTTAIDQDRVGPPTTTASTDGDALLAALQPGPRADAMLLWSEPTRGVGAARSSLEQAIFAARGSRGNGSRIVFEASEQLAPAGPNSEAAVGVDPDSDRAVAVWREGQLLRYSVGAPAAAG